MKQPTRTAIITGGTKGIGAMIAKAFVEKGYAVLISSRSEQGMEVSVSSQLRFKQGDVRQRKDHFELVQEMINWQGHLDTYVNCAGVSIWKPIEEVNEKFWSDIVDTNAAGTFWGCQAAATALKAGGSIINISSLAGKRGSANNSVYCASKFAVNGITQSLAKELGPKGIRVNAVCPVYVETAMILKSLKHKDSPSLGQPVDQYLSSFAKGNAALHRLPKAEEIAKACLFFASEESSAITGQCLNVDCGVLPQ